MSIDKAWKIWLKKRKLSWMWVDPDDVSQISYTEGYKQGVKDEKKRISDGLRELEKNK